MCCCVHKKTFSPDILSQYVFCISFNVCIQIYKKCINTIFGSPRQVTSMQTDILHVWSQISWLSTLMIIFLEIRNNHIITEFLRLGKTRTIGSNLCPSFALSSRPECHIQAFLGHLQGQPLLMINIFWCRKSS